MKNNFPLDALHPEFKKSIQEVSRVKKFNIGALATSYLNATGNSLLNKCELQITADWVERSNLWTIHVADSGTMKSHIFHSAIQPILKMDEQQRKDWKENNKRLDEYNHFRKTLLKEADLEEENINWLKETGYNSIPKLKPLIEYTVQNISTEKMYQILDDEHNDGSSILVHYDEIAGLFKDFNKFRNGSDEESWLKFWNNYGLKKSRISEDANSFITQTNVSIIGTTQFKSLYQIFTSNRVESGHVYRFLFTIDESQDMVNVFEDLLNNKDIDLTNDYYAMLDAFMGDKNFFPQRRQLLTLDDECYEFMENWRNEMNAKDFGMDPRTSKAILAKMDSYIFRIALILNRIRCHYDQTRDENKVGLEDLRNSAQIIKYFTENIIYILDKVEVKMFQHISSEAEQEFYKGLPESFTTKNFTDKAMVVLKLSQRSAERRLQKWTESKLLHKKGNGQYFKTI